MPENRLDFSSVAELHAAVREHLLYMTKSEEAKVPIYSRLGVDDHMNRKRRSDGKDSIAVR